MLVIFTADRIPKVAVDIMILDINKFVVLTKLI